MENALKEASSKGAEKETLVDDLNAEIEEGEEGEGNQLDALENGAIPTRSRNQVVEKKTSQDEKKESQDDDED